MSHRPLCAPARGKASFRFLTGEMYWRDALWAGSAWRAVGLTRREETGKFSCDTLSQGRCPARTVPSTGKGGKAALASRFNPDVSEARLPPLQHGSELWWKCAVSQTTADMKEGNC